MFDSPNILIFLLAIIPGLMYSILVYVMSPINQNISIRLSIQYLFYGMLSIFFVSAIHFIFPNWLDYLWLDGKTITNNTLLFRNFVQIGLTEEIGKGLVFLLITSLRLKSIRSEDKPYAIMFYAMMVSMGFALVENISYGWQYYNLNLVNPGSMTPENVLAVRSVTAILAHMLFGLVMGFFFALGFKKIRGYNSEQTLLNLWGRSHNTLKKIGYIVFGILASTTFHGLYNYTLTISANLTPTIELLLLGFIITYFMSRELIHNDN